MWALPPAPKRVLGQDRVTEARFHQALDGLGIFRLHDNTRTHADVFEKTVDEHSQYSAHGLEQEGHPGQLGDTHGSRLRAPDFAG